MQEPRVTVLICTRNRPEALAETLRAWHPVQQTSTTPWELLIVDNASDPDVRSVVEQAEVSARYVYCPRIGLGAARDFGWRAARGEIVAFTDDDCYPHPDFIDQIATAFAEHPQAGCIGGRILLHDPAQARVTIKESEEPEVFEPRHYLRPGAIHGANMSIPRHVLEAVGGLDPELGAGTPFPCEDIDVITAVLWAGYRARYDPRPTVRHDHGRYDADIPKLMQGYDKGRGAHYAKYVARKDTRRAFLQAWWRRRKHAQGRSDLAKFRRELASAFDYLRSQGKYGTLLLVGPVIVLGAGAILGRMALVSLRHKIARLT